MDRWIEEWIDGWEDGWTVDRTDENTLPEYIWKHPLEMSKVKYSPNTVT